MQWHQQTVVLNKQQNRGKEVFEVAGRAAGMHIKILLNVGLDGRHWAP
jgi:hypothetical protein